MKWGASMDTLQLTYKTYIRPILTFGEEILICASDSNCKRLEVVQNKALRIITGGTKSTPKIAMEMFSDIQPLTQSRESAAIRMYERIIRTPNSIWKNYKCSDNRLKSKVSFIHKIQDLYNSYEIDFPTKIRRFTFRKTKSRIRAFNKAKKIARTKCLERIKIRQQYESTGKLYENLNHKTIISKERKVYVANFRKITGHDLLFKHLARIGVKPSPICPQCNESDQTSDHLLSCRKLDSFRNNFVDKNEEEFFSELYWHVRENQ